MDFDLALFQELKEHNGFLEAALYPIDGVGNERNRFLRLPYHLDDGAELVAVAACGRFGNGVCFDDGHTLALGIFLQPSHLRGDGVSQLLLSR
ncbi:MAG: hypothetical protein PHZ00_05605 [Candidatus Peribacteraceae bacterium]|nr:hypothetical protein [Candidatus Peribacteraceae bacterium]